MRWFETNHRNSGRVNIGGTHVADILKGKLPYICITGNITRHGNRVEEVSGGSGGEGASSFVGFLS